ncbi:hypothetical protein EON63_04660 [archaeon]|nr:MAG: hypothetical protein EON63_04660 [archaeon]
MLVQVIYNKTSPIALNVLKASFGVMLGISLVVVFVGLAMLQSNGEIDSDSHSTRDSNSDSNNKKSSKHNRRYKPSNRIEFSLTDYFFIEDLTRIFLHPGSTSPPPSQQPLNFLEACYSFLFGDGDANQGYGIALIIQAAQYIRANNGLVVAEELAPFVFNPPALPSNTSKEAGGGVFEEGDIVRVDESYLLPLVLQLNGNPIVTENGHILYYFEACSLARYTQILQCLMLYIFICRSS